MASKKSSASSLPQDNVAVLRRAARTVAETVEIAEDNTRVLVQQGETIDNIDRKLDEVQHKVNVANYMLKSMDGITGAIRSLFSSAPKKPESTLSSTLAQQTAPVPVVPSTRQRSPVARDRASSRAASGGIVLQPYKPPEQSEEEHLLDTIGASVALLKQNAVQTGQMLDKQTTKLADVQKKTDETTAQIQKASWKTKTIT